MSLKKRQKELREKLGGLTKVCRESGTALREAKEKNGGEGGESKTNFDKAFSDFESTKLDLQEVEAMIEVEDEHTRQTDPAGTTRIVASGGEDREEHKKQLHRKAFLTYLRSPYDENAKARAMEHLKDLGPEEVNALLGTEDELGGFTVPEDFRAELLKAEAGVAAVRAAGARVVPTSRNLVIWPTVREGTDPYSTDLTAGSEQGVGTGKNWKPQGYLQGGTAPPTQDKPTFGNERVPVHVWQPDAVEIARELLDDSAIPLDSVIAELFGEVKGLDEDWAFILGDGVEKPEGLLVAAIAEVNSGAAGGLTYGGMINLHFSVPSQYRGQGTYLMNSLAFAAALQVEDTGGTLIFPPNAPPSTLFMRPVQFSEFMPAIAADANPILFGAFRHYIIAERQDIRIQRLVERYAPNIGLLPHARVGGQLTRPSAFRKMKIAA